MFVLVLCPTSAPIFAICRSTSCLNECESLSSRGVGNTCSAHGECAQAAMTICLTPYSLLLAIMSDLHRGPSPSAANLHTVSK